MRRKANDGSKIPYKLKEVASINSVFFKSAKKRKLEIEEENSKKIKIDFLATKSYAEEHKLNFAKQKLREEVKER